MRFSQATKELQASASGRLCFQYCCFHVFSSFFTDWAVLTCLRMSVYRHALSFVVDRGCVMTNLFAIIHAPAGSCNLKFITCYVVLVQSGKAMAMRLAAAGS